MGNLDYGLYKLRFLGKCKGGEATPVERVKTLDTGAFVYDYDHNAEFPEDLRRTHKPFFDVVRKHKPNLPIIMMTRP